MTFIDLKTMERVDITPPYRFIVCLGNFDGVHLGHSALLNKAVELKKTRFQDNDNIKTAVWCFSELPSNYGSANKTSVITPLAKKLDLFAEHGIDFAIIADFPELKDYSPELFIEEILKEKVGAVSVVCGYNFSFGKGAKGNSQTLRQAFADDLYVIPKITACGIDVSSSNIRSLLSEGDVESAAKLLGRPYSLTLKVSEGKHLGRKLGFPTVNQVFLEDSPMLQLGVYITKCMVSGDKYVSITNVGVRPTVENTTRVNCETHIIDYSNDLYGKEITVEFYKKIRDEIKFDNVEDLKNQVFDDIRSAISYFK